MEMAFGNIIETLTNIFVDIYLNLSWVNHESSRLMKQAEYKDFVAATDGNHEKGTEMHCWHALEPKFFCSDKYESPEYTLADKCDPSYPDDQRDPPLAPGVYSLEGDEIVPVVSSNATIIDVVAAQDRVNQKEGCRALKTTASRAIRSPANGMLTDPEADVNWISAYN